MLNLRTYQNEAVNSAYGWLQTKQGNPLISLATGTGKSLVIAKFCQDAMQWKNQHVIVCTHSKELVEQDYKEFYNICPEIKAGIYCAGLGKKEIRNVTFASIQSLAKIKATPYCDLFIIDEVQAVNDEKENSLYAGFIARLKIANPDIRIIGLSATIYRMGSGLLYEGDNRLFEGLAYQYSVADGVRDGYLAPLISKSSIVQGDTSAISISQGDFKIAEAETEFDKQALTEKALDEVFKYGADRKSWVFFCITVKHAEHVRDALRARGVDAEAVSDKTPSGERESILTSFKAGKLRALCSINIVAVGFNATCVDLIAILRPTLSPGWHVQALGRGTRLHPDKVNCLVLDFAGNLERLGPITHIVPPSRGKRVTKDDYAGRVCPECESVSERGAVECIDCGFVFPVVVRKVKHSRTATTFSAMSTETPISEKAAWYDVQFVHYEIHQKMGSPNSLKVMYKTEAQWVMVWLAFESPKEFARQKAREWWLRHGGLSPVPATASDAYARLNEVAGLKSRRIRVRKKDQFYDILAEELISADHTNLNHGNLGAIHA